MLTIKAMTGGETYAAQHLSNNDYYSVGERVPGQWMGRGAELLGLDGEVSVEHFEAIHVDACCMSLLGGIQPGRTSFLPGGCTRGRSEQ